MPSIVVGLGELLWDCFGETRRPGGAPANVAFQANQLGLAGTVLSRVGDDELGRELRGFLKGQGLTTAHVQVDADQSTSTVTVEETPNGPEYVIHENVAWDRLAFTSDWASLVGTASAVCFGTLAQRTETGRLAIAGCLDHTASDCLHVFDVNLRQNWYSHKVIGESLAQATIVKLNEAEVPIIAELIGIPSGLRDFAVAVVDRWQVGLVCITMGGDGCLAVTDDETVRVRPEPIVVADTVGAGDAFTAGLIYARLHAWPLERSARFANAVGGLVASRPGAMPDLREEFAILKRRFE
ncbi:MAG: carbohydrate kinase [Planctomycetaceae bacterium]